MTRPGTTINTATGTIDPLRAACLNIEAAVNQAEHQLHDVAHPLSRIALGRWNHALTDAWHALSLVYTGIAEARQLPDATPASIGDIVDGLRAARADANQAALEAARIRQQLAAAEDHLRHTNDSNPQAAVAADQWHTAITRLDLAAARLAIGTQAINHYLNNLTGAPTTAVQPPAGSTVSIEDLTAAANTTATLVHAMHRWDGRRGFWTRARHEIWKEWKRNWTW